MKSRSREERIDGCEAIGEVARVILIGEAVVVSSAFGINKQDVRCKVSDSID